MPSNVISNTTLIPASAHVIDTIMFAELRSELGLPERETLTADKLQHLIDSPRQLTELQLKLVQLAPIQAQLSQNAKDAAKAFELGMQQINSALSIASEINKHNKDLYSIIEADVDLGLITEGLMDLGSIAVDKWVTTINQGWMEHQFGEKWVDGWF